jgi:hypothetical protein
MKFLTTHDWEKILKQLSFNKTNSTKESSIEKIFFEVSQRIKEITSRKKFEHNAYGIAMTLFHYYVCFNDLRTIDRIEICFACLYMSSKIQFYNIPLKTFINDYKDYVKDKSGYEKKPDPDFIKYEIQLYSQLGYDLDIETPFHFFYEMINQVFALYPILNNRESFQKLKNFCFNLINDTYTRPLSIYYHPKIICLSCLIFSLKFLEFECDISKLIKDEKVDLIAECMEKIYQIYSRFIEDNKASNGPSSSANASEPLGNHTTSNNKANNNN